MEKKSYTQTLFDQAFVTVVTYLYKNDKLQQKVFAGQMGIPPSNLNDILASGRGVPKSKIEFAKYILRERYNVNPVYLDTLEGSYLNEPVPLNVKEHPQVVDIMKENEMLKSSNKELTNRIEDLRKLNETQEQLINSLKEKMMKQGKK